MQLSPKLTFKVRVYFSILHYVWTLDCSWSWLQTSDFSVTLYFLIVTIHYIIEEYTLFLLVFWYYLVPKHSTPCRSPAHTPLGGVRCPCPRPPLLWYSSNLGSGSCENSRLRAVKSHEKPHHRHSFFAQEHHLSWTFAFYLLSYAAALLCPTTSLVGPDLLACLPGQASHLPRRCGTSLVIVDCGWPWFLSPDLLCFSCLSTRDCVPGQWGHCPCLCCGHPQLLTCLPLRRWLPLLLPHMVFFAHSESGKHVSFLWSQHKKKPVEKIDTHGRWALLVRVQALLSSPCSSGSQHVHVSTGLQNTEYKGFLG